MKRLFIILLLCVIVSSQSLFAFGPLGHYITGEIAQSQLTSRANKKVTGILNNSSVAMVSNWADFQKSNPDYKEMNDWHYLNLDSGLTRQQFDSLVFKTEQGQNVYQVRRLINHLKDNPTDTNSLLMLIHLVEDMHCPMHFGRAEDRGGNDISIIWFNNPTNLHSLWDDKLIETQKLSYKEYASHLISTGTFPKQRFNESMLFDWAWDNYQNAEEIYSTAALTKQPYAYIYRYRPMLEEALSSGGYHLAMILNEIYK